MTEKTEVRQTFCTHCKKDVDVTVQRAAPRGGHANLADHDEVVCLDFGDECDGEGAGDEFGARKDRALSRPA